jgi:hypothetical protein
MIRRLPLVGLILLLCVSAQVSADDAKLVSGPQPGQVLPGPFHPFNVTGPKNIRDRFHCLVCDYGNDPVALVFIHGTEFSPGVVKLLQGLNAAVVKNERARLHSFGVLLDSKLADVVKDDDDREAMRPVIDQLDKAAGLNNGEHVALALDSADDVKAYKLADEAEATVILYRDQKVVANHAFQKGQLDDKAVEAILKDGVSKLVRAKK